MTYEYIMTSSAKATAFESRSSLRWAVGWIVPAESQDDHTEKMHICAVFEDPNNAELFIDSMPTATRNRFFITRIDKEN